MRAVIQRVERATIEIDGKLHAAIGKGLLVLLGIIIDDNKEDIEWLSGKIARLRIFDDENGVMNLSLDEIKGEVLVVSQFTLHASTRKGNRPSYFRAANPDYAIPLYKNFIAAMENQTNLQVKAGVFGAEMKITLVNDGPVTIIIDSKSKE
ncbi:MAG TPA: D-aminoacyl-tRNA deacylase [Bacteroidales bacterium]|nr:D-aminoacyl-tRNA deacylase [Bacteroidales bacterium]